MDNFAVEICYDLPRFAASFNKLLHATRETRAREQWRWADNPRGNERD
jgi:hypothetical protein